MTQLAGQSVAAEEKPINDALESSPAGAIDMVEENKETPYEEVKLPPISGKGGVTSIDKSEQMARELQAAFDQE